MKKTIYVYLLDTYADWEISYILPIIKMEQQMKQEHSQFELKSISYSSDPVFSAGGLKVSPDCTLEEIDFNNIGGLILPGADTWQEQKHNEILNIAEKLLDKGIMVSAICGATFALANKGILNKHSHTSNSLDMLKESPEYLGEDKYNNSLSVCDSNLITASVAGNLEFTRDIMLKLNLFPEEFISNWYNYYKTGDVKYYLALLNG